MRAAKKPQVVSRRFGYPNTGYAFKFVFCPDEESMASYVSRIPGVKTEAWMIHGTGAPYGYTVASCNPVLPGLVPEADGSFLCEVTLVVREAEAKAVTRMSWHHEIGHAVDFARSLSRGRPVAADPEFPAFCTEFLLECYRAFETGDDVVSGFLALFPWLCECEAPVATGILEAGDHE